MVDNNSIRTMSCKLQQHQRNTAFTTAHRWQCWHFHRLLHLLLFLFFASVTVIVHSLSTPRVVRNDLPGIWKLSLTEDNSLRRKRDSSFPLLKSVDVAALLLALKEKTWIGNEEESQDDGILLKLRYDGSFQQLCNGDQDHYLKDKRRNRNKFSGCWHFTQHSHDFKLAFDRRYHPTQDETDQSSSSSSSVRSSKKASAQQDILLRGKITRQCVDESSDDDRGNALSTLNGNIIVGKYIYPKFHKAYMEDTVLMPTTSYQIGNFTLKQVVGFQQVMGNSTEQGYNDEKSYDDQQSISGPKHNTSQFYYRKFFMTIVPIQSKVSKELVKDQATDIRTMPIQFFRNHTFEAIGINKILRGRYEIIPNNRLRFHVSRFGCGRSVKGSVFSEGIGLTHDDERTYEGSIIISTKVKVTRNDDVDDDNDDEANVRRNATKPFSNFGPSSDAAKVSSNDGGGDGDDGRLLRVEGKVTYGTDLGSDARYVGDLYVNESTH